MGNGKQIPLPAPLKAKRFSREDSMGLPIVHTPCDAQLPGKAFDVLGLGCTAVDDVVCMPSFRPPIKRCRWSAVSAKRG